MNRSTSRYIDYCFCHLFLFHFNDLTGPSRAALPLPSSSSSSSCSEFFLLIDKLLDFFFFFLSTPFSCSLLFAKSVAMSSSVMVASRLVLCDGSFFSSSSGPGTLKDSLPDWDTAGGGSPSSITTHLVLAVSVVCSATCCVFVGWGVGFVN